MSNPQEMQLDFVADDTLAGFRLHRDLNRAHEALLKAKRQVELLSPLVADCERHGTLVAQVEELRACREALKSYFAGPKLGLLDKRITSLAEECTRQDAQVKNSLSSR